MLTRRRGDKADMTWTAWFLAASCRSAYLNAPRRFKDAVGVRLAFPAGPHRARAA
jgi:hypothetical protein